jgi:hypothetical protein
VSGPPDATSYLLFRQPVGSEPLTTGVFHMMHGPVRLALVLLALAPVRLSAQSAPPRCDAAEYRQFDFWVGRWNVVSRGTTTQVGTNDVTREEQGCLIHEHWAGANGGTGQSFNYYDRRDGLWHQLWVSSSGGVLSLAGGLQGGVMHYSSETVGADGRTLRHHLAFTPNPDGSVRQHWQVSADGGATWTDSFDAVYRRQE